MEIERIDSIHPLFKTIFMCFGSWPIKLLMVTVVVVGLLTIFGWNSSVYAQGETIHIVRAGENLTVIGRRYGVGVNELARYNGIANPNLLRVGQSLRIPTPVSSSSYAPAPPDTSPAATPRYRVETSDPPAPVYSTTRIIYTVWPNDTLYGIGRRFGVSIQAIKMRNGLRGDVIWVGQRLIIP